MRCNLTNEYGVTDWIQANWPEKCVNRISSGNGHVPKQCNQLTYVNGVTDWIRTNDLFLRREAFFQLNYGYIYSSHEPMTGEMPWMAFRVERAKLLLPSQDVRLHIAYTHFGSSTHHSFSLFSRAFISSIRTLASLNCFCISRSCARVSGLGGCERGV